MRTSIIGGVVGVAALVAGGPATADDTGITALDLGEILPGTRTYRIFLDFDNPDDVVQGILGDPEVSVLGWDGGELVQDSPGFETLDRQDVPFQASGPADTWVTIDDDPADNADVGLSDAVFTPGFLDPAFPGASVINGSFFEESDGGGWVDAVQGTPENGGEILIAQLTIPEGEAGIFRGTVEYVPGGLGAAVRAPFLLIPGPGAAVLLGLAALTGTRRRR